MRFVSAILVRYLFKLHVSVLHRAVGQRHVFHSFYHVCYSSHRKGDVFVLLDIKIRFDLCYFYFSFFDCAICILTTVLYRYYMQRNLLLLILREVFMVKKK